MPKLLSKGLPLLVIILVFLFVAPATSAHSLGTIAGSEWVIGQDNIYVTLQMSPDLVNTLQGMKPKYPSIDACSEQQLHQIAVKIFKPYIAQKLSVWINDRKFPVAVGGLTKSDGYLYDLALSVNHIGAALKKTGNTLKIDYRMFFAETDGVHVNVATLKSSDPNIPDLQNEFTADAPVWEQTFAAIMPAAGSSQAAPATTITSSVQPHKVSKTTEPTLWSNMGEFVVLGIKHILTGYDHILFLLALIVIGLSFKDVLKIISSFTVAHSITLFLAAMNIVRLNSRFVESVIALSICYIALENILNKKADNRWMIAFGFGLIHGFGFASILQDLTISKANLISSVLSFNVGVEMGQLSIFLVTLPILNYLRTKVQFRRVVVIASVIIFGMGFVWLVERVCNVKLLWF